MTRKDFELIASVLSERLQPLYAAAEVYTSNTVIPAKIFTVEAVAHDFANVLGSTNPNFDRARFLKACGVDNG